MKLDLTFIKVKLEALFMKTPSIAEADLRLLKVFRTVVSCGGFAGAQAELNVGLSTITIHMQTLEQRLGCKLCTRGRSGFQLTDQGRAVYSATERLFSALETFRLDVYDSSAGVSGEIRVAMIDNLITHPECRLDDAFEAAAPDASFLSKCCVPPTSKRRLPMAALMLESVFSPKYPQGCRRFPCLRKRIAYIAAKIILASMIPISTLSI
jgi:hypothetical protein